MDLLKLMQVLMQLGLNKGTSGNASVREKQGLIITPSGVPVEDMHTESLVFMQMDGSAELGKSPSSEWRFHRDILKARPEVNVVIHTHSMFATTLACLHKSVPAFHYMIAVAGGNNIRCAPYALFGSQHLSDHALVALKDRKACLLANHGMVAVGKDFDEALSVTVEVENLCEQYWRALQVGEPNLLSETQMHEVFKQFKGYGKWG